MNEREKFAISEKAHKLYLEGKQYKVISEELDIPINTLKSWKRRYQWQRECTTKKGALQKSVRKLGNNLRNEIKEDLLIQLSINETEDKRYVDLVEDYMAMWDIKNRLIQDVKERGINIEWHNGRQEGIRKNDSVSEFVKVNTQMLKILNDLNLKPSPKADDDDDL